MAVQVIREVSADVVKRGITKSVYAKQNDFNSRFLNVRIQNDGKDVVVESTAEVILNVERPDKLENMFYGTVNADGTVKVPMTPWMLKLPGTLICDVSIISADPDVAKLTTMSFNIYVEEAVISDGSFIETEEYSVIVDLLTRIDDAERQATAAAASAQYVKEQCEDATEKALEAVAREDTHIASRANPHEVTKEQLGLGNVPNVATNDQTPTFTEASTLETTKSGEKLSVLFGKITKAISELVSHLGNKNNPHALTASQVGAAPTSHDHDYLPLSGGSLTGNLSGANINLSGSLYVGGKTAVADGKTGVAFGASGNITSQASTTAEMNFIIGTATSAISKLQAKSGELIVYGDKILSMYTIQDGGVVYGVNIMNKQLQPNGTAAGDIGLGRDGRRFNTAWLVNAANVSSDRNIKTNVHSIDERFVNFFDSLEPISYKLIGENHDRNHLGFISQDVKAAMDDVGISDMEFGGYCRDQKVEEILDEEGKFVGFKPILDEEGNPVYSYSLRYGEFIALNTKMIQLCRKEIKAQQEEINNLRSELEALKSTLNK